jgi:hypothetical protein
VRAREERGLGEERDLVLGAVEAGDIADLDRVEIVDGGADGDGGVADQLRGEDRRLRDLVAEGILRADVVDVGDWPW